MSSGNLKPFIPVANFTIASTPRTFDAASNEWKDGDTLFLRASVWRDEAENVAASLTKGSRVVGSGVPKPRTYETKTREKRTVLELEVEEIGLSLRYTAATVTGRPSSRQATSKGAKQDAAHPADKFTISPREYADDDAWFGLDANPSGHVSLPGAAPEPAICNRRQSGVVGVVLLLLLLFEGKIMAQSVKDRVYAAAERISAERRPTVSTVRAAAGVSNADATRYLKEWSQERQAAGSQLAATPAALLEAAARLAGTAWAEASALADARHAGVEAAWAQERTDRDAETAELVADLDRLTAEKDAAVSALATQVQGLQAQLTALTAELEESRAAERAAAAEAAGAATKLAASAARDTTALQGAYDALLARITPTPATGQGTDQAGGPAGDHGTGRIEDQ